MATYRPPTIAEMLEELGAPRNYAEQGLMRDMRKLERKQVEAEHEAATAMTETRREVCRNRAYEAWNEALAYNYAIKIFRSHGSDPIMVDYDQIVDRLDAEAATRRVTS